MTTHKLKTLDEELKCAALMPDNSCFVTGKPCQHYLPKTGQVNKAECNTFWISVYQREDRVRASVQGQLMDESRDAFDQSYNNLGKVLEKLEDGGKGS